jgi:hypothetical protein
MLQILLSGTSQCTSYDGSHCCLTFFFRFCAQWKDNSRATDFTQEHDTATLSHLLRNIGVEDDNSPELEIRSISLKQKEDEIDRLQRLKALGFKE